MSLDKVKGKGYPISGEVAVIEPTYTEVGCHSSSPASPSPALERFRYPFFLFTDPPKHEACWRGRS